MTDRKYDYRIVDVFTTSRLEGNPLAVFPAASGISDAEMQRIALETNLSETVFFFPASSSEAHVKVRIFTPRREMPFAGHPTIGSAYVLSRQRELPERFGIEENVGIVPVESDTDASGNRRFWLTTPGITFMDTVDAGLCARLLALSPDDIWPAAPPQYVSAGSPFLFVALNSVEAVDRAEMQSAYLREAIGAANGVGTFVFARKDPQSSSNFDVHSRMFAPQSGITEDPATGSATGPLAAYMRKYGLLPDRNLAFVSEQGVKMGRRSVLQVRIDGNGAEPAIRVGGSVVPVAEGTLFL